MHHSQDSSAPSVSPAVAQAARADRWPRALTSLQHRDFRFLFAGEAGHAVSESIEMMGRNWFLWQLSGSPLLLGLMNFSRAIPRLIFGVYAGVLADRLDKRWMLFISQALTMVLKFAMAILITTGWIEIWHVFALAFLSGLTMSFVAPARESMTPYLVPRSDLLNAISLNRGVGYVLRMLVPAAAGVLIEIIGVDGIYYIAGVTYFFILFATWRIRTSTKAVREKATTAWADVKGIVGYVSGHPTLFRLLLLSLVPMVFAMPYFTLLPIFATDVLNIGASGYGLLMGVSGVGATVSAVALAVMGRSRGNGWLLLIAIAALGVFLVAFSASRWLPLSLVFMVGVGLANMANRTLVQTLLLSQSPQEMYGRVMSIHMLDMALMPFGSVLAGALADVYSAPVALASMSAVVIVLALGVGLTSPGLMKLHPESRPSPASG